ncbi:MAG: 2-oxoacid:acceptor oxidoreductase family protein [Deltaproteobacteria bacterium]|nr:2-oxoacid:acceptor oxidoreductase family protein [Deltaproteobacteria bacterium]
MYYDTIIAGFGGQGVMFMGNLLAMAGMYENRNTTYMPVYGVEMRGGTANCTVVISDREIGSPIIEMPRSSIVMNLPSLLKFGPRVKKKGLLMVNSSLIDMKEAAFQHIDIQGVPTLELASAVGREQLANMVMMGAFVAKTGVVSIESIDKALKETLAGKYQDLLDINRAALEAGAAHVQKG